LPAGPKTVQNHPKTAKAWHKIPALGCFGAVSSAVAADLLDQLGGILDSAHRVINTLRRQTYLARGVTWPHAVNQHKACSFLGRAAAHTDENCNGVKLI
jgi:hypothetical protein